MAKKRASSKAKARPARKAAGSARRPAARAAAPKKKTAPGRAAPKKGKKRAAPVMDQEAMMAAWQTAMTPGEGHRWLEPIVGSWTATTTMRMGPDAPPEVTEGTSEHRWVLGGRYVEQVYKGTTMGMPFEGLGFTGYDNIQRKYVGTWMDTFSTGMMNSLGTGTPSERGFDTAAVALDPSGKPMKFTCKLEVRDQDHHSFEMWTKAPDGRKYCNMRVEYARR
jgi:hypothetical protein